MKILIIRPFPEKINIDSYNVQEIGLAKALIEKGHECGIVFFETKKNNSEQLIHTDYGKDIHIYWRTGINILKNGLFWNLKELISEYDVVQVHEYDQLYSWYIYTYCKKPVIVYHGPYFNSFNKRYNLKTAIFDKIFLNKRNKKNAHILTKSEMATTYLKNKGFANVKTVGVGLDKNKLVNEEPCEEVVKTLDEIDGFNTFLYVGKIEERRNILFLLDVFSEVKKCSKCKLVLVGTGLEEYKNRVRAKIIELGIEESVIWIDKMAQSQLPNLYKACKFFLFPTEYDIFGMVLLEAMYYGMTVFSSVNGGSSTLIHSGENGYIFNDLNVDAWSNQIKNVLNRDDSSIGLKAQEMIQKNYLWSSLADDFIDAYENCV